MSFRQDKDPGSVKSLLALLRSNQDRADSAGNSPTPSPATSTAIPDPYSLASNPFHQATYGYSGSSNAPNGYQAGYQSGSAPPASSLQDLLATLRQTNSPAPIPNLDPATSGLRNATSSHSRRGAAYDEHDQAHSWAEETGSSSSKRRRVEREVDPYAENVQPYEPDEEDGPPDNVIQEQVDTSRDAKPERVVDLVAEEEEEQDDGMNRYGYTPEQMAGLSIEQGRPIFTELLERNDVRDELAKVRSIKLPSCGNMPLNRPATMCQLKKEQEELERHMWKKREEIVADYKKKLPTE